MQDDVERVARAIFESDGQSWSEVGTAKSWYLDAARAAMAATLELAAEAVRSLDFRGEDYAEEDGDKQYLEALDEAEAAIRAIGAKQ